MKRRLVLVACLLLLLASSCAVPLVAPQQQPQGPCPVHVGPETRDKLQVGMSRNEVEAIIGGPPGDYRTNKDHFGYPVGFSINGPMLPQSFPAEWYTDEYAIKVYFDRDGKAESIRCLRGDPPPPAPTRVLQEIKYRLGW